MKVALVNVNGSPDYTMLGGRANAALNVLEDALTLEGHEVRLFPSRSVQGSARLYAKKLAGYVVDYDPDVVGISSTSPDFVKLVFLSHQIKMLEDIPIYAGGPHFQFDYFNYRKKILNSVMDALLRPADDKRMIVDGVNVGGGGAFVDYLKNPESLPEGLYRLEKNQVIGSGEGRFLNISRAPFAFEHTKWKKASENGRDYTLMLMGNSRCPNHCDYCVIEDINITISPEMVERAIPKRLERFSQIALADSAPFLNPDYYDEVLGRIRKRVKSIPISVNLDPSALIRDRERIYEIVIKHDLRAFFIGREVTSEKAAQAIGRRYLREVRTEERLVQEKK